MTVVPWPEIPASSVDRYRQTDVGYIRITPSPTLRNASESSSQVLVDTGSEINFFDSAGTLLSTYSEGAVALYSDVAFTKSGSIVTCVGGVADRRGAYRGIPVSKKHTIYKGTLLEYNVDQMNRYSHEEKCDCPMPIGDIVYSGFDLTNRKFVVVSRNRTLVFDYTVDNDYSLNATYNHDAAIGFAEGNVILRGDGEPGKLTDCFDLIEDYAGRIVSDANASSGGGPVPPYYPPEYDPWEGAKLHFYESAGNVKITSPIGDGGSVNLSSCGYTGYFAIGPSGSGVDCDVWRARREGAWSGSITFTVYISANTAISQFRVGRGTGVAGVVVAPSYTGTNPVASAGGTCGSPTGTIIKTITLYDDNTISVT